MAFMALPILVFNVVKALTAPSLRATVFFTTQSFMAAHFAHTVSQFFQSSTPTAMAAAIAIVNGPPNAETSVPIQVSTRLSAPSTLRMEPTIFTTVVMNPPAAETNSVIFHAAKKEAIIVAIV